jgi:TPR repeat protein
LAAFKTEDYSMAFKELLPLAEVGNPAAQHNVSLMYKWGKGTEKNPALAFPYSQKSALQGFGDAQMELGTAYYSGMGVAKDVSQAVYWWQKASDQGVPRAAHNMALMYSYGTGVPQDSQQAVSYYRKAIEAGLAASVFNLGVIYASGAPGVPKNLVMSYVIFSVASPNDSASAGHRGIVESRMTPSELLKAKEVASKLKLGSRLPTEIN